MPAKKLTNKRVRCCVCSTLVPESECVNTYADFVCRVCDEEMTERDNELYEQDMQEEIDRVWGYE